MKKIAIVDYDAGNMGSVQKAFEYLGQRVVVTREPQEIMGAEGVVLPGVGAFGDAMEKLQRYQLTDVIRQAVESGKPFLGICLGLQLLFESSEESAGVKGLSLLQGKILRIPEEQGLKIPHIGWNSLELVPGAKLFRGLPEKPFVYFVHSYYPVSYKQ
ncbi:MAG: imidazole glycerol phosphate synthase subunit HisH, partial [Lachnospiraceae bacterium]|nr:imidazole glycerol phosphate synthase subunit HisH [Lachnospiraceae bacterium]